MSSINYLALGDSYTIGEQVLLSESFPYQAIQLLRQAALHHPAPHLDFQSPEIIAKTGWTTDELAATIDATIFLPAYEIVSLLVGVNNQYRGRPIDEFSVQFEELLQRAISFAGSRPRRVFVLSIPDWGVMPVAEGKDREKISEEIDAYNNICKVAANNAGTHFIEITGSQRQDGSNKDFIAPDQLHPSGKEYAKWAAKLAAGIQKELYGITTFQ